MKTEDASEEHNVGRKSKITDNTPATNFCQAFSKRVRGKEKWKLKEDKSKLKREPNVEGSDPGI